MKRFSPAVERIAAILGLCAVFALTASIFTPDWTQAEEDSSFSPDPGEPVGEDPHVGLISLGVIEDDCYAVHIYAGDEGPLYSVYDAEDGRELGVLLDADEVAEWFPELPIPAMGFPADAPVGLADPDASRASE
ncbi:MAG: hypothetical protein SYC29_09690 [Planctomycetota bacterium]|nr:hypothetical protein [Planctomycetota bacterium]